MPNLNENEVNAVNEDSEKMEISIMDLVVKSGNARSYAMEALFHAREGDYPSALAALENCDEELTRAHAVQTEFIQRESRGETIPTSLFLIHAQDHLMNAAVVRDLAREMLEMHRRLRDIEQKIN